MDYTNNEQNLYNEVWQLMNGNQASYNNVYAFSSGYIYNLINELLSVGVENGEVQEASTAIINQVYSYIYYNIGTLQNPQNFYGWAGQIATTETVRYLVQIGKFSGSTVFLSEDAVPDENDVTEYFSQDKAQIVSGDILVDMEKQRMLQDYMSSLSLFAKAVVQYYFYEGMPVGYIAQSLGCSQRDVKRQISEIRNQIEKISGETTENVVMYDMAALPVLWCLFKSTFSGIPAAELAGGAAVGAVGVAAAGATFGTSVGAAAGASASAAGTSVGAAAGTSVGAAAGASASAAAGTSVGAAAGTSASAAAGTSVGAAAGISTGVKVAIGIGALLAVGGGTAAVMHFSSNDKKEAEVTTETSVVVTEKIVEIETQEDTEETFEAEDLAADSIAAYEEFMAGNSTAVVDYVYDEENRYSSMGEYGFTYGETVSLSDIENRFVLCVGGSYDDDYEITEKKYGYIDAGNDGVQELEIRLTGTYYADAGDVSIVIKYKEDGLHLTFVCYSLYRMGTSVDGQGVVSYWGSGGYATSYLEEGVLDADGVYHNVYGMLRESDPVNITPDDSFRSAADTMKMEFGDDYYPGVSIEKYELDGVTYYVAADDDTYAGTTQNLRYHELIESTTGHSFVSEDEIAAMVKETEDAYVPNGLSSETVEIDWVIY